MTIQQHAGRYAEAALRTDGSLAKGVSVSIYLAGSSTLAVLYPDRDRSGTAANPVTTDAQSGMLTFWAEPGLYDAIGPGVTLQAIPVGVDSVDVAPLDDDSLVPVANLPVGTTTGTVMAGDDNRIAGAEQAANKGVVGGYAPLDSSGVVPAGFLPGGGSAVLAVAGKTGYVVLAEADITGLVADLAARVLAATTATTTSTSVLAVSLANDLVARFGLLADGTIISGEPPLTISNVTGTTTVTVTTSASHGYGTGDVVTIASVGGISGVNGVRTITRTTATAFTLNGATGSGSYTSGGKVQRSLGGTGSANEGMWNLLLDATRDGLVIRGREGSTAQGFLFRDYKDAVIVGMGQVGGGGLYSAASNDAWFVAPGVFSRIVVMTAGGGIRMAAGDPAGGQDVVAEGNATTPPTGVPDGSHQGEGAFGTGEGVVRWTRDGRPRARTSGGHEDELLAPVNRRVQSVSAPGGDTTLILSNALVPVVATTNITPTADDQTEGALVRYATTAATNVDAGVLGPFGAIQPRWAPYTYCRLRTDPSAITNARIAFGLVTADIGSNMGPSVTGAFATAAGAWIRYSSSADTSSTTWRTVTCDGTTATVVNTAAAIAADSSYEMAIEFNAALTWVKFFVNGVRVSTHTTNLPSGSAALAYIARLRTLASSARALRFGRITWSQT